MSDGLKWFEISIKFASSDELRISLDDTERMFQAVREALTPFVRPEQLDISQCKPEFISETNNLRLNLVEDLKIFRRVSIKGWCNLWTDVKRLEAALGFKLKGGPKEDL